MDAILLVGGQGTRLRPLTARRHKSLVPICNRPAIEYLLDWLAHSGIQRVILALGLANQDLATRYPPGTYHSIQILPIIEHTRLESGGAIRNAVAQANIQERFLVLNGDIYLQFDLHQALTAHIAHNAELTIALHHVDDPTPFGVAVCDQHHLITRFIEKPPPGQAPSHLVNAGAWIFERPLVDQIPPGPVRVEETLFPTLIAHQRPVLGYQIQGPWADIGTPSRYLALHHTLLRHTNAIAPSATIASTAQIHTTAIGPGSVIGPDTHITGSVIWENVHIHPGATIIDTILADSVTVGQNAHLQQCIVGPGATIDPHATPPPGTTIQPDTRYHATNAH